MKSPAAPHSADTHMKVARELLLETVMSPDSWDAALDAFAKACGGRAGQIIALNGNGRIVLHRLTDTPTDFVRDVEAFGLADAGANPRLRIGSSAPVMQPRADQDYVSADQRARSAIYAEMFDRYDFAHNCQIVLMRSPELLVRASVSRTKRQGIFDRDALRAFTQLAPYLQAAIRTRAALGLAQVQSALTTLDAVRAAAFVLNVDGRVIGVSTAAAQAVDQGVGLRISGSRLRLDNASAQEKLQFWLERLARNSAAPTPVPVFPGASILDLQPLPAERDGLGTGPAALAILRPASTPAEYGDMIRIRYNLTSAEAAIALALSSGLSVQEIATDRGVSLPTVRSQLQSVYAKLGVRRQGELVARLRNPAH